MKILVGIDGTDVSKRALKAACDCARAFQAEKIYVLRALEGYPDDRLKGKEKAKEDLAFAEEYLNSEGLPFEKKLATESFTAGEIIENFAKENEIDLVVIGVVRKSQLQKLLFGSTAHYVILKAPCPVFTVK